MEENHDITRQEIFELMGDLGMITIGKDTQCGEPDDRYMPPAEVFEKFTCKDLVYTMLFVDGLMTDNNIETIKKFLVCLLYDGK